MNQGAFKDEVLDRIRRESDLLGQVSQYVSLKKSGQNYVGLCPFHSEKTPSFTVSPSKQIFHCFGCHAGGDVFTFAMKMQGLSFPEAVRSLAENLGIKLSPAGRSGGPPDGESATIYRLHADALDYYHDVLVRSPQGGPARDYLARRGIKRETIETFRLGFAPASWDALQRELSRAGWTSAQLERAGLAIARDRNGQPSGSRGHYDRFRNRLLFPIFNLQGRICGFGGRTLDPEATPKYLNSPETAVFSKGGLLYALEKAREEIHRAGCVIIVEGYFDVIAAHQAGIKNVVATLGTALTDSHLGLVKRFTQKIKLIFDPDAAGVRAALRSADLLVPSDLSADVVLLPDGQDPDSFLLARGPEAFAEHLSKSTRLMDFVIGQSLKEPGARSIDGKLRIVRGILPMIGRIPRPVEKGHYLRKLAEDLQVREYDLLEEMRALNIRPQAGQAPDRKPFRIRLPKEEEIIIHLMLHRNDSVRAFLKDLNPEDFSDPRSRQIVNFLVNWYQSPGAPQPAEFLNKESGDPEWSGFLTGLSVKEPDYEDAHRTLADCLRALRLKKLRSNMAELQGQISRAEQEGRSDAVRTLQNQLLGLKKKSMDTGDKLTLRPMG
jgi:DNA primase